MMLRTGLSLLAVTVFCTGTFSQAEEAAAVLAQCRQACGNVQAHVIIQRERGTWRGIGVIMTSEDPTDPDLRRLALLTTIDSFEQSTLWEGRGRVTWGGIEQLAAFRHLRRLFLRLRLPKGSLKVIGSLRDLEYLSLVDAESIGDKDLVFLKNLQNLRQLHLPPSVLTDSALAIIKSLKTLEELNLSGSRVTDAGLAELESLQNLRSLNLGGTQVTDAGVACLKGLVNLQSLDLDRTKVTDLGLVQLKSLINLRYLDVRGTKITCRGLSVLRDLPCVEHLAFSDGAEVSSWSRLPAVQVDMTAFGLPFPQNVDRLSLSQEMAQALGVQGLPPSVRSVALYLWDTVGVVNLMWLNSLPNLRQLYVEGRVDSAAKALVGVKCLTALVLADCRESLSDDGVKHIAELRRLESVEIMSDWNVSHAGMAQLRNLAELRRLKLGGVVTVADAGFSCLGDLKQLRELSLRLGPPLRQADGIASHVQVLPALEELAIHGATLTDVGLNRLASLKTLRRLDLTDCQGFSDEGLVPVVF